MPTCPDMTLPVALVLSNLSADLVTELDVAVGVLVGVLAVQEDISTLSVGIKLSYLYTPLHRGEGDFSV